MNSLKETNIKNRTYYFLDDMINIKNLDPSKIQINERIINTISGYSKESNGNKYLTLGPTNENKDTPKNIKNYGIK